MTPKEIRAAGLAFAREIGPRADIYISVNSSGWEKALGAAVYPTGVGHDAAIRVEADDWAELFDVLRAKWSECSERRHRETVRTMALEIIRLTADQGECTDAALRAGEFDAADVARYAAEAVADANAIASNGPFAIVPAAKANAA